MHQYLVSLFVIVLAAVSLDARGDKWRFPAEVKSDEYMFGEVRVVRTRDATQDQEYPDWSVSVYRGNELRALYRGVSFTRLAASRNERVFVGISNSGLPGTAVIIFDSDGNLRLELKHRLSRFHYCDKSITLYRVWYDEESPELRIEYDEKTNAVTVTVKGCDGKQLDVLKSLLVRIKDE